MIEKRKKNKRWMTLYFHLQLHESCAKLFGEWRLLLLHRYKIMITTAEMTSHKR